MQNKTTGKTRPPWKSALPLFLTLPAALGLYWLMRSGFEVNPHAIVNGGIIGASVLGSICSLDWAFRKENADS
jgi:membrane protein insertase Oxa1/YidC/SpoIIIJ